MWSAEDDEKAIAPVGRAAAHRSTIIGSLTALSRDRNEKAPPQEGLFHVRGAAQWLPSFSISLSKVSLNFS